MALAATLLALGLVGGFFSGLLGLGGAILMVPLLLFVPQMLGFAPLGMRTVAAISMVQVFFSALSAVIVHRRNHFVSRPLVLLMGVSGALASFAGAWASRFMRPEDLVTVFAGISTVAAVLMFLPRKDTPSPADPDKVPFHRPLALAISVFVGVIGGMVGAPGAFIYVPLLLYVLRIPLRITLGSTLAIVLMGAVMGTAGKVVTGQVPWGLALPLVVGSLPGAQLGAYVSKYSPARLLNWLLIVVITVSTLKVWTQVPGVRLDTVPPALWWGVGVVLAVAGVVTWWRRPHPA